MNDSPRSHPNVTLAVLATASLAYSLLQSLVTPALPTVQHALRTSETGATWVLTAYLLSAAVATPILGRLGDGLGKRRVLIGTLGVLAFGTLLAALATSLSVLILGRVLQGVGGGVFPLAFGIVRDEFPRERVSSSIGMLSALLGLGGGLGVILAGVIVDNLSYHWLFWIPFVAIVASLACTVAFIPESPERAPGRINWLGAAFMSVGLTGLLLALSETSTWGWGSARTLGLIAVSAAVLTLWVRNELGSASPLVDMRVMAIRGVWTTNLVAVLIGAGMFTAFVLIPQFAQTPRSAGHGFGSTVTGGGLFVLPMALVMLVVGSLAGRIERRLGSKPPLIGGAAFTTAGFVLLLAAHGSPAPVYLASACMGAGIGLAFAAMANLIVHAVPRAQTGAATGMNTVARSVGAAFGGQLAATFLTNSAGASGLPSIGGYDNAFVLAIVASVAAVVVGLLIPGRERRAEVPGLAAAEAA